MHVIEQLLARKPECTVLIGWPSVHSIRQLARTRERVKLVGSDSKERAVEDGGCGVENVSFEVEFIQKCQLDKGENEFFWRLDP